MAIPVVQSVSTTAFAGNVDNLVLSKPSGTVDGDLLIAFISGSQPADSTPSGWTQELVDVSTRNWSIYSKIASSEGASWTWGITDSNGEVGGGVIRIDGHKPSGYYDKEDQDAVADDATPSYTNITITPAAAQSLLIFFVSWVADVGVTGVSGYAIATDNPTWTERIDLRGSGNNQGFAVATALRPETSATGVSSCTLDGADGTADSDCALISILANPDVSVSPAVITMAASVQAPTVTGGATVSPAVVTITAAVQAPTVSTAAAKWSNASKNSTSWTNQNKS